jgi:hypothetical protein
MEEKNYYKNKLADFVFGFEWKKKNIEKNRENIWGKNWSDEEKNIYMKNFFIAI